MAVQDQNSEGVGAKITLTERKIPNVHTFGINTIFNFRATLTTSRITRTALYFELQKPVRQDRNHAFSLESPFKNILSWLSFQTTTAKTAVTSGKLHFSSESYLYRIFYIYLKTHVEISDNPVSKWSLDMKPFQNQQYVRIITESKHLHLHSSEQVTKNLNSLFTKFSHSASPPASRCCSIVSSIGLTHLSA